MLALDSKQFDIASVNETYTYRLSGFQFYNAGAK